MGNEGVETLWKLDALATDMLCKHYGRNDAILNNESTHAAPPNLQQAKSEYGEQETNTRE